MVAFLLAVGLGANDVANSFATSVGAKVLTLRQACWIAAIAELLGALLMGSRVTATIATQILRANLYADDPTTLMLGMLASLTATTVWLFVATYFKLPVSATHCIVAAITGFGLVSQGWNAVYWSGLSRVALSWLISPVFSGLVSACIFLSVRGVILNHLDALERAYRAIPYIYGLTIGINVGPVVFDLLLMTCHHAQMDCQMTHWGMSGIAFGVSILAGFLSAIGVAFVWVPRLRNWLAVQSVPTQDPATTMTNDIVMADLQAIRKPSEANLRSRSASPSRKSRSSPRASSPRLSDLIPSSATPKEVLNTEQDLWSNSDDVELEIANEQNQPSVENVFSFLQILTATFASFTHGGNDVSNAIGPLVAIIALYAYGSIPTDVSTPFWVLIFGGSGIIVGLAVFGWRVIETLGADLIPMTPSHGFCIEIGAALTVLLASMLGLPISSTHAKVGSIVAVGFIAHRRGNRLDAEQSVNWSLFGKIVVSWVVTIPFGALLSILIFFMMQAFIT